MIRHRNVRAAEYRPPIHRSLIAMGGAFAQTREPPTSPSIATTATITGSRSSLVSSPATLKRSASRELQAETSSRPLPPGRNRQSSFVNKVFGGEDPIGQNVVDGDVFYQIIGVVGNIESLSLDEDPRRCSPVRSIRPS